MTYESAFVTLHHMNHSPSLADLARHLEISPSTVSKALNGRSDVSRELREKVVEAAARMGYTPHPQARKLAMKSSGILGVFLLNRFDRPVENYFGYQFLGGMLKEAQDREKDLLIFSECRELSRLGYPGYCRLKGVEAAVFVGLSHDDPQGPKLPDWDLPWVSVDTPVPGSPRGFITSTNEEGIAQITAQVLDTGLGHLAYLGIRGDGYVSQTRRQGFLKAMNHRALRQEWVLAPPLSLAGGREAALTLLSAKERPQGIICATDLQALGVYQAARILGLKVPHDLAVTGFDNIQASGFSDPPLTTYAQDILEMGKRAVAALYSQADDRPCLIPGHLVPRESVSGMKINEEILGDTK